MSECVIIEGNFLSSDITHILLLVSVLLSGFWLGSSLLSFVKHNFFYDLQVNIKTGALYS